MPWPRGVPRAGYQAGLTQAEEQLLEQLVYQEGVGEGVRSLYHRLVDRVGIQNAPARRDISTWFNRQPGYQIARMPAADRSIAPVLPTRPLERVFVDTMYLPRAAHRAAGVGLKVYRCVVVYVDALTKFVHLHGVAQLIDGRPQAQQTRDGAIEFVRRARVVANNPDLHVEAFRSDKGSEFLGAFETWRAQEELNNPGLYQIAKTPGTRSSYNSIAEATIKAVRRLWHGHYRAVMHEIPVDQRPLYDWMDHIEEIISLWNTGWRHSTKTTPNKALNPQVAPTYAEVADRIRRRARRRYGNRAVEDGASQPGFSAAGLLQVGQLVRRKRHHDGAGTARLTWHNIKGKTADANWTEQVFRVSAVVAGTGMRLTTYQLQDLQGNNIDGRWSRQQLLPISEDTELLETDDDDDDNDDDDDDIPDGDADPRPHRGNEARYQVGDVLNFDANYFQGNFPGLRAPIARARIGTVVNVPRGLIAGRRAYTIRFGRPGLRPEATIDLPRTGQDGIDNDDDVTFIQET